MVKYIEGTIGNKIEPFLDNTGHTNVFEKTQRLDLEWIQVLRFSYFYFDNKCSCFNLRDRYVTIFI